jgi:hypothetical protein
MAFIVNAAILATINSISIETRFAIENSPNTKISSVDSVFTRLFYYLKILPYKFAEFFNLESKKGKIPDWIKLIYVYIITFLIALFVYHFFLSILGYKKLYKYFFGNLNSPKFK